LSSAQLTSLISTFTATLSGAVCPPGVATGKFLRDDCTWQSGTAGVTSVTCGTGLTGGTITTSGTCAVSLTAANNYMAGPTALNASTFTDGPSAPNGISGTWFAFGTVLLNDTAASNQVLCKLWDGTTVIDGGTFFITAAGTPTKAVMGGNITNPAANIKVSCKSVTTATSQMLGTVLSQPNSSSVSTHRIQ
jgi:hypothetical protein